MSGLNQVQLIGNLGKDEPKVRFTPTGKKVVQFDIATNRVWKNDKGEKVEATDWHKVQTWGYLADACQNYLHAGNQVFIQGRIQYDVVGNAPKEGEADTRKYYTKIVASEVKFLTQKPQAAEHIPMDEITLAPDEVM